MKKIFLFFLFILALNSNVFAVEIDSPRAILIDVDTGRVLYQKNAYEAAYPASTTKILTAILVLENCELDEMVTASSVAVNSVYADGTTASIQPRRNSFSRRFIKNFTYT
jgi:D-alanyl-D-alanine carboxypeptidase